MGNSLLGDINNSRNLNHSGGYKGGYWGYLPPPQNPGGNYPTPRICIKKTFLKMLQLRSFALCLDLFHVGVSSFHFIN